ncbi:hypothetical protein ABEF95_000891 [Exophiala dermatitidis]
MAPATEICFLPLQGGSYSDDASSGVDPKFKKMFDTILAQEGCQRLYWGRQVEHPSILTVFIDWDSVEHHEKFIACGTYKPFTDEVGAFLTGPPRFYHVNFDPQPPTRALADGGPFATEFITIYFPTDYSADDQKVFEASLNKLVDVARKHSQGFKTSAGGWAVEQLDLPDGSSKAKVFIALFGWESVEAHQKFRETQVFKDNIHLLRGAKDLKAVSVFHVLAKEASRS